MVNVEAGADVGPAGPGPGDQVAARWAAVRARVAEAAVAAGRPAGAVRILLATKTVPASRIVTALDAGANLTGENRVQELLAKYEELAGHPHERHFIGHVQRNKIGALIGKVDCVQTVDSAGLAERLQRRLDSVDDTLDVMVQVNVSAEPTKSGVAPERAEDLLRAIAALPRLRVRGYMTIGLNSPDRAAVRVGYAALRRLRDELAARDVPGAVGATELSMGMSGDFADAIAEGATIVRLGSAVFGERPSPAAR
jgi:pyridoxal phosphate enzyme (YggS family)